MKRIPPAIRFLVLGWLIASAAACSWESLHHFYPIPFYDTTTKVTLSPRLAENAPRRIAILPFSASGKANRERQEALRVLRESFGTALGRLRTYEIVPPEEVDRRLEIAGISAQALAKQPPESLGRITGADTLLYGDLERTANITLYVYSHTVYEGTFRLVDAAGGEPLWKGRLWEGRRAGLIVEAFVIDMFLSQPENKKLPDAYRRVADHAVAKLVETIPDLTPSDGDAGDAGTPAPVAPEGDRP